ncbi:hypothetical protein DNTS_032052 [Danionella cerebrum]|uniref:Ig-like domain-containing protein n=1 Tax=Danionella cerebrum TaxID=2873325 RepID=A0A553P9J5_9TELE|nr:hypothetical protein DNTS_032052 [Danionella translucida]
MTSTDMKTLKAGLLLLSFAFSVLCDDVYVYQNIVECQYSKEDLSDMVYMVKLVFNQKLLCSYDSRLGKYVGYDEYGTVNADYYNSQIWKVKQRRDELFTICKADARYYANSTTRKVPPVVIIRSNEKARHGQLTVLECNAYDFYPQPINISWLIDGEEVTDNVISTEAMENGDWSFQKRSYLELKLRRGVRVSCRVEHSGLERALVSHWVALLWPLLEHISTTKVINITVGSLLSPYTETSFHLRGDWI